MVLEKTAAIPASPSAQLQVVLNWVEAMSSANFDLLETTLADNYNHVALPENLKIPALESKEKFIGHYKNVLPAFEKFTAKITEVVEAPGTVVLHASADAMTKFGFPYVNEYIIIFHLVEAGGQPKLVSAKEFVDSKFTAVFMETMQKALQAASQSS